MRKNKKCQKQNETKGEKRKNNEGRFGRPGGAAPLESRHHMAAFQLTD